MYEYKVRPGSIRIVDGDTLVCSIQLGFHVETRQTLRLLGINTPELRGPERKQGLVAKRAVRDMLRGREVRVKTVRRRGHDRKGKYGRYIATIFFKVDGKWHNLNQKLLTAGLASKVSYK